MDYEINVEFIIGNVQLLIHFMTAQCLKIVQKVAFNFASEASYVYILSGQKLIKYAQNGQFGRLFENLKLGLNSFTRQVTFNRTKIVEKFQNWKN